MTSLIDKRYTCKVWLSSVNWATMDRQAVARLGELLRRHRKAARFSQQELADKTGLSRVSISNYENGLQRPYHENLVILCRAMGVTTIEVAGVKLDIIPADRQVALTEEEDRQLSLPLGVTQRFPEASLRVTRRNGRVVVRVELEESA